jgi:hypothetical protein
MLLLAPVDGGKFQDPYSSKRAALHDLLTASTYGNRPTLLLQHHGHAEISTHR